jgi:hypothetical protein
VVIGYTRGQLRLVVFVLMMRQFELLLVFDLGQTFVHLTHAHAVRWLMQGALMDYRVAEVLADKYAMHRLTIPFIGRWSRLGSHPSRSQLVS